MAKEFVRLNTRIDQWKDRFNDLTNDVGDIALLTTGTTGTGISTLTGSDSDLVTAVNELDLRLDSANTTQINSDKLLMRGATSVNTIKGHLDVEKTLDVTDSASFASNVSVDGNANIAGTLTAGATTLESTLDVTDSAGFSNNVSVDGSTVLGGTVAANGATSLRSTLSVAAGTTLSSTLDVTDSAEFNNNVSVDGTSKFGGAVTANSTVTAHGGVTATSTLDVTDSASFGSNVSVDGNANIGGTLTAGATTLESTLDVTDSAGFANNISVDGTSKFGGVITANSATNLKSTLTVTGTTTLNGSTNIPGTTNFSSTGAVKVPVGTTAQRITALRGHIRYNTDYNTFEGYDGSNWRSLVGVRDADRDTYITAEKTSGADSDLLNMVVAGNLTAIVEASGITLSSGKDYKSGITLNTTATRLGGAINELHTAIGLLDSGAAVQGGIIGELASLTTTAKTDIVSAINELDGDIGALSSLTTTSKTSVVSAINELDDDIGALSGLNTTDKTDIVSALNETYDRIPNIYDENDTLLNG